MYYKNCKERKIDFNSFFIFIKDILKYSIPVKIYKIQMAQILDNFIEKSESQREVDMQIKLKIFKFRFVKLIFSSNDW